MGGTVVPDLEVVSVCDATTGWTGSPVPTLRDATIWDQIQGNDCLQSYSAGAAVRNAAYDFGATAGYWKNFAGKMLIIWFAISKKAYSATNPPMKIRLTDGSGYYRDWHIFTKGTLPHTGWIPWIIHADVGYEYESNPLFDVTKIRYVGWRVEETVVGKTYIWWDAVRWGTGLTVKGGTSGDWANLEKLYTEDILAANAYGVVSKIGGAYLIYGQIKMGSTVNAEATYFKDASKVVIFGSIKGNPSAFSKILFQGNAGADTEIYFGTEVSGKGISGLFISSENSDCRFALDATSTSRMKWQLCGTTFFQARRIEFPAYDASWLREVRSCNFEGCWEVYPSTTEMQYCNFINPTGESPYRAVKISDVAHRVTYCNFINCPRAIEITVAGDAYKSDGLMFTNCTCHIDNTTAGGYVTVTARYGSNADPTRVLPNQTYTIILNKITLTFTDIIVGSEICILNWVTKNIIINVDPLTEDHYHFEYDAPGQDTYVDVIVLKNDYEWYFVPKLLLPTTNANIPVAQRKDRVYSNPYLP